jgi:hypothetical protein
MTTGNAGRFRGIGNHPGHDQKSHGRKGSGKSLKDVADSPLVESRSLGGGLSGASTTLEVHEGGTLVRKEFPDPYPGDSQGRGKEHAKRQADAEDLGARVGDAVGVETPAVMRVGDDAVLMEYVPSGRSGAELSRGEMARLIDSEQGRLMGLHDALIANSDRNPGNFLVRADGSAVAIDHAGAFGDRRLMSSPFVQRLRGTGLTGSPTEWTDDIGISASQMKAIGGRLRGLESEFQAAGRQDWYDDMMGRFDALSSRAH